MLDSFFSNEPATTEIYALSYSLSLHDALPIGLLDAFRFVATAIADGSF
eukprot:COSAG02_NODE_58262_length_278_cov_0.569832_1_plen_48_part_01